MDQQLEQSKTQRKREMLALQDLGEALVALSVQDLEALNLPENLLEAILQAKQMSKRGALRRQLQYIGRLMREVDAGPIRAQLDAWESTAARDIARLHQVEHWRDRLLRDEAALDELLQQFPNADAQRLRSLIGNAQREQKAAQRAKSSRSLFQILSELVSSGRR
jgi:ribosome-associated protein